MERDERSRTAKRVIWGSFLIALGSAFLLDHLHIVDLPSLGSLWPAVFFVIAVGHVAEGRLGSALTFLLLGVWFFACEFDWYGLDYSNSWPLVLIAIGAGIVVRALGGEPRRRERKGGES
jgi:hypothetical protein